MRFSTELLSNMSLRAANRFSSNLVLSKSTYTASAFAPLHSSSPCMSTMCAGLRVRMNCVVCLKSVWALKEIYSKAQFTLRAGPKSS